MFEQTYRFSPPVPPAAAPRKPWRALAALAVAAASCVGLAGNSADAASTGSSFGPNAEATQTEILSSLYGGTFTQSGDNFSNGQLEVRRLGDDDGGAQQIFQNDFVSARAVATFARNNQTFGLLNGNGGGGFSPLFNVGGSGFDVTGSAQFGAAGESPLFGLQSGGSVFGPATGGRQLQRYSVTGGSSGSDTMLLFWEDTASAKADFDYNDLVVEVAAGAPGGGPSNVLIPLPLSAWSALSVMGGMGLLAGIKRLRKGMH